MVQLTDVEIAGAGYMLASGSYRRMQEGVAEGRPGRVVQKDFFAGARRAVQLERDRGFDGLAVGPAFGGQVKWSTGGQHLACCQAMRMASAALSAPPVNPEIAGSLGFGLAYAPCSRGP